jgi:hypothetical protein
MRSHPSGSKHPIINYAKEQFGNHLCALLLAGYGEEGDISRRSFNVLLTDEHDAALERHLEIVADGESPLPHGQSPLVLAALFRLLAESDGERVVTFRFNQLLELLVWTHSDQSVAAVEEALSGYFNTSYVELRYQPMEAVGKAMPTHRRASRLITGYDVSSIQNEGSVRDERKYVTVLFNVDLIEQLRQRFLFGIEWDHVLSVRSDP